MIFEKELSEAFPIRRIEVVDTPTIFINEPTWRWKNTIPNYFNIWYSIEGTGAFMIDGAWIDLSPGQVFLFKPGQHVRSRQNPGQLIVNFTIHARLEFRRGEESAFAPFCRGHRLRQREAFEQLMRLATEAGRKQDELGTAQAGYYCISLLALLWRDLWEPVPGRSAQIILKLIEAIDTQPGRIWKVGEAAEQCGLSRSHFTREFCRAAGESPNQYILRKRIERAKVLLETTSMRIGEIAEALGYSDVYFFSRQFRQKVGKTPSEWRKVEELKIRNY